MASQNRTTNMAQLELSSKEARDTGGELFDGRSWGQGRRRKSRAGVEEELEPPDGRVVDMARTSSNKVDNSRGP